MGSYSAQLFYLFLKFGHPIILFRHFYMYVYIFLKNYVHKHSAIDFFNSEKSRKSHYLTNP